MNTSSVVLIILSTQQDLCVWGLTVFGFVPSIEELFAPLRNTVKKIFFDELFVIFFIGMLCVRKI